MSVDLHRPDTSVKGDRCIREFGVSQKSNKKKDLSLHQFTFVYDSMVRYRDGGGGGRERIAFRDRPISHVGQTGCVLRRKQTSGTGTRVRIFLNKSRILDARKKRTERFFF